MRRIIGWLPEYGVLALLVTSLAMAGPSPNPRGDRFSSMGRAAHQRLLNLRQGIHSQVGGCVNEPDCEGEEGEQREEPLGGQAETSIAVDSTGQHIVIGFNDGRGFLGNPATTPTSLSGFMYSDDGGNTFVDGGQLPVGPTTTISGQLFPQVFGDPDVKYLGGCNFVYVSIMLKGFSATGTVQTLSIHRSSDCGHTWTGPYEITPATNPNGLLDADGDPEDAADKELSDVDPDTGRFMVCFSNFTPAVEGGVEISCTYTDNVLTGTPPVFAPRRVVAGDLPDGQGSAVRFAGNGSPNVYVAWSRFPGTLSGYANNVGFARSTDNGVTWNAPINIANDFVTMDFVLGNDRSNNNPSVAVDKTSGPFSGYIYAVYSNNNSLDGSDVAFQRSTNGGVSFSAPVRINGSPGRDRTQWFPYATVDRTTGRVWVFYYDQSVASSGDLTQVTYQYSDNGGSTWSTPAPLSPRPFKAGWGNDTSQPNLGDYNQAVAQNGTLYAAYAGTRLVGFPDGQPATVMTTPDVLFAKVSSATVSAALRAGAITFTDANNNGNIDPGEQIQLTIPLRNFVTNAVNAITATAVTATLSTTTPNVTIVQPTSAYASIAPGVVVPNTASFVLQTSPAFKPGTPIELALNVVSTQGTASILITQPTGTPVFSTLISQTFDGVAPGTLPSGWTAAHGAGSNTVPWTTSASFNPTVCGTSNKAFHQNANDRPGSSNQARWERLFSPLFTVPNNADYVTVDFDVCYDTEDDPVLPTTAYDGFFLRVTDQTPGRTLRSVLAEAFEEEFTTGNLQHYPKHFPRNSDPSYFEDMSVWGGDSNGTQHVHMKFPGMAGSVAQLRWEFAQDQVATCASVRPGHQCGVTVDNVVVRAVTNITPLAVDLSVQSALVRNEAAGLISATLTVVNNGTAAASNVRLTGVSLSGTPATALPGQFTIIPAGGSGTAVVTFPISVGAPGSQQVLQTTGTYTGGTFTSSTRVTLP